MKRTAIALNAEVTKLLDGINHPFRTEIELLRVCILEANTGLKENIKWNGPNYFFDNKDRITMRVQPPKRQVQLVFHRGAKTQQQPSGNLINNTSKLIVWKENDRAIVTFRNLHEIEAARPELVTIINEWIEAAR